MANELTIRNETLPAFLGQTSGPTGFENVDNDCVSIPFLKLAQSNTPQAQRGSKNIPGLEAGMFFNQATGRIYGNNPSIIVLGFFRTFVEWEGEGAEARFVRQMTPTEFDRDIAQSVTKDDKGKSCLPNGNRIVDTRNFFIISAEHPEDGILLYAMTSTAIPASKKWLSMMQSTKAPIYAKIWELGSEFTEDKKGNYFKVTTPADRGFINEVMFEVVKPAFDEVEGYKSSGATIKAAGDEDEKTPF